MPRGARSNSRGARPLVRGRACDPAQVGRALSAEHADIVAVVHGETSTGVVNPIEEIIPIARKHDALTIVDAVH
jgi:aspartate aminotransferase-like enzyme